MAVYRRGNRWWVRFMIRGVSYAHSVPEARTKKEALAAEARIKSDLLQGRFGFMNQGRLDITFAQYARQYLAWSKQNKRSYSADQWRMRLLVEEFGLKRLSDIRPLDVERYKLSRRKAITRFGKPPAPASINRELRLLSHVLTFAQRDRLIHDHPIKGGKVRLFREDNKIERYLTEEEEARLVAACTGRQEYLRPIIITALYTGMRRGEIFNLKWFDINLQANVIHIRQSKSGKPRSVHMPPNVRAEIEKLLPLRPESQYVFANPHTGKPFKDIKSSFQSACKAAGIKRLRFHDLRHTFATRLATKSGNIVDVANVLGHSTIITTMRYAHALPDRVAEAMDELAQPKAKAIPMTTSAAAVAK